MLPAHLNNDGIFKLLQNSIEKIFISKKVQATYDVKNWHNEN